MKPSRPSASAGADAAPQRPTTADVLGKQEYLRRDLAVAIAARSRADTSQLLFY